MDKVPKEEREKVEDGRNQPRDWAEDARRDLERRADRGSKKIVKHREKRKEKETRSLGVWQTEKKTVREAKEYSDIRMSYNSGSLSERAILEYLRDFPANTEYQAFVKIAEMAERGELEGPGLRKLQEKIEEDIARSGHRKVGKEENEQRKKIKMLMEAVRDRAGRPGPPRSREVNEKFFSVAEWEEAILREYSAGRIDEDELKAFLDYYSKEKKSAYKRLADEEGIKLRGYAEEVDWEEIGDRILTDIGLRKELVKDIPTEGGRAIFEEMLDEQIEYFKQILRDTISREDREKKIAELSGDKEKAEKELVAEAAKKFLAVRELFTHGILGYNKEKGQMVLGRYSDLDGKCAVALLGKAGIDIGNVGYLTAGEKKEGQITLDSSNADGLVQESKETVDPETGERKIEITTAFDHHGPHSHRGTSATAVVYKVFNELGLLKFEDDKEKQAYDKLVEFATRQDNFDFPEMNGGPKENNFEKSYRTILGMHKKMPLEKIIQFFKESKKSPTDELTQEELERYGVLYWRKKGKDGEWAGISPSLREQNKEVLAKARELSKKGFLVVAGDGKKFLIDTTGEAGGEFQWAAASLGYDGIIRYNQDTHGFFIALNKGELDPETFEGLGQGRLVRKSMFLQPMAREKLLVTLDDLLGRLKPGFEPENKTELKRFLEREPWRIRAIVSRAPEGWWWTNTPRGKKVVVRGLPEGFKSGDEAYLLLEEPRSVREERIKYGGDFLIGYWESDEMVLPKKPEAKKTPIKAEVVPPKKETKKPEVKKEPSAKVGVKKPPTPEVKVAPPAKAETKPSVPKVERERTPEDRKKIEEEIARGNKEYEEKVFSRVLRELKSSLALVGRDVKELERNARDAAKGSTRLWEQAERKKYGI